MTKIVKTIEPVRQKVLQELRPKKRVCAYCRVSTDSPKVVFFNTPGTKFELFPLDLLAEDINKKVPPKISGGFGGITLAYNVEHKEDVEKIIEVARNAGAKIVKEPQEVFWGGYHAYFSDLDGYYWEVAWGPDFKFDDNGMLLF